MAMMEFTEANENDRLAWPTPRSSQLWVARSAGAKQLRLSLDVKRQNFEVNVWACCWIVLMLGARCCPRCYCNLDRFRFWKMGLSFTSSLHLSGTGTVPMFSGFHYISLHFTTFHYMSLPYAKVKDLGIPSAMETELRAPRSRWVPADAWPTSAGRLRMCRSGFGFTDLAGRFHMFTAQIDPLSRKKGAVWSVYSLKKVALCCKNQLG